MGLFLALFLALNFIATSSSQAADGDTIDFAKDVLPILSNKCFVCHGPDVQDDDMLRLDSHQAATEDRGGYRAIDPEHPLDSAVMERVLSPDDPMPPADAEKQLTDEERRILVSWVKAGGDYAQHWAFVRPTKADSVSGHPVDHFIAKGHKTAGIEWAAPASKHILARRTALTLTGLPPEPQMLREFLADTSGGAFERYVDRLMAMPRFGEHQARYWLDAVRYGDTHGLHLDNRRGIYPYRDWVVRAMNENMPIDQFIRWQLAGDLLPTPTMEQLVATGYVRMNPTTAEGGVIPAEFQAKNNFDRVETLGTVFLGLSLTCARCHSHKYDPVPQEDYYRLMAFFNSTAESPLDGNKYEYAPVLKVPADQDAWRNWQSLQRAQKDLVVNAGADPKDVLDEEQRKQFDAKNDRDKLAFIADKEGPFADTPFHEQASALLAKVTAAEAEFTTTLVAKELPTARNTHVLRRGEYNMPVGEAIGPGILSAIGGFPDGAPLSRAGLAEWLTDENNPLVSRVLVNQIWLRTFGDGLVRTPEDFGLQGEYPTHPELLDWLAVDFRESNWDLKRMLKLMVTSRAFQQSAAVRSDIDDAENRWWSRGPSYRLDAEVLRDLGLWASGIMDPTMGGEGVKPYQPVGMWKALAHPASNTKQYVQDKGAKLYRKSLYVYWKRTSPHPMMTLFDAPSRESSCIMRSRTNTATQSLGLFNETQRVEMARMLAERLLREAPDREQRLSLVFTLLASRPPNSTELKSCSKYLDSTIQRYRTDKESAVDLLATGESPRDESLDVALLAAWTQLSTTLMASDMAILLY